MPRPIFAALVLLAAAGGHALATEGAALDRLAACRTSATNVDLRFSFDGQACVDDEAARTEPAEDATLAVAIPLKATADVCAMAMVPVAIDQTISADETVTALQIAVFDPQGNAIAAGETAIIPAGEDCGSPTVRN